MNGSSHFFSFLLKFIKIILVLSRQFPPCHWLITFFCLASNKAWRVLNKLYNCFKRPRFDMTYEVISTNGLPNVLSSACCIKFVGARTVPKFRTLNYDIRWNDFKLKALTHTHSKFAKRFHFPSIYLVWNLQKMPNSQLQSKRTSNFEL